MEIDKIREVSELTVKSCLTPFIYKACRTLNKDLQHAYGNRYKAVLGGGCVFGIYFSESAIDVFKTHDFDIKLVDDTDSDHYVEFEDPQYTEMVQIIDKFMTGLESYLNTNAGNIVSKALDDLSQQINNSPEYNPGRRNTISIDIIPFSIPTFTPPTPKGFQKIWGNKTDKLDMKDRWGKFLCTMRFNFNIKITDRFGEILEDSDYTNSLIDITPYANIPGQYDYLGNPSLDMLTKDQIIAQNRMTPSNINDMNMLTSYFKNRISSNAEFSTIVADVTPDGPLYYVSLGYLIWDTVRMINFSMIDKRAKKLMRYLKKYHYLLRALSSLKEFGRCDEKSFRRFRNKCLTE